MFFGKAVNLARAIYTTVCIYKCSEQHLHLLLEADPIAKTNLLQRLVILQAIDLWNFTLPKLPVAALLIRLFGTTIKPAQICAILISWPPPRMGSSCDNYDICAMQAESGVVEYRSQRHLLESKRHRRSGLCSWGSLKVICDVSFSTELRSSSFCYPRLCLQLVSMPTDIETLDEKV